MLPASARADVELDPATDTVRVAARVDGGTLTPPAPGAAATIGLRYVREHRAALGLTAADLDMLGDPAVETFSGIRQVRWPQEVDGIAVADAELRVNVTDDGRVLSVLGSPSSDLPADTTPRLPKPAPDAELTIYENRLAYRYEEAVSAAAIYDVISDADTGRVLKRTNLVKSVDADVWNLHPSVGTATRVSLDPWLLPGATTLEGRWVRAFSDTTPNDAVDPGEEVTPGIWPLVSFPGTGCSTAKPCTWSAANKQANRQQNGVQAFYLANRFRDHLAQAPINFDEFEGNDRLILETNDGGGMSNANMYTPPEGKSPRMQMFLWQLPYRNMNSGDDASILFHEYGHGLTGRLVKTPDGVGALSSWQAGAMGEGWSDFYAKDFIVSSGLETDTPAAGEVHMGVYSDTDEAPNEIRTGALDCPVGVANAKCPAGGGYTYGDFAHIINGPEVHFDGEIWAQTLWDLRRALPAGQALRLISAALRLSPPEPSFLDARNAILAADVASGSTFHDQIWAVFAARGMGFYASTIDGADVAPVEDTSPPPVAGTPRGDITGTVRDAAGAPVAGITVSVGGLETGPDALKTTTRSDGTYTLNVPARTYKSIVASAPGYDRAIVKDVAVPGVANATVRRNWAIGATLQSTAGSENADMGCGPKQAFDGLPGSTWSTAQAGGDKELVIKLPEAIDISGFGVDPGAGCGDSEQSATAQFQVAVGPGPTGPWTVVVADTLGAAHRHVTTVFPVNRSNVTYVRMLPMSTQTPGASYIDLSEFAVYGTQAGVRLLSTPPAVTRNPTATFTFDGGTNYECTWDGVAGPCTSPASRTLGEGPHTFSLEAADDPTPVTYAWTIDTVAPATTISGASVSDRTATFTFGSTDATAVTHACRLDGVTTACTSPQAYGGLADGTHAFSVVATDAAGNTASASRSVTVDATPPETTITWAPPPILTTRDFTFAFSASKAGTFTCSVDGAPAQPCASPLALTGLAEGAHSVVVTAIDAAGRADPTPARSDFTVVIPGLPPAPLPTPTPTPPPAPKVAAVTSASAGKTVSRRTGRVTVKLRGATGAKVVLQAKVGTRVVGKATKTLRGTSLSVRLVLDRKRLKVGATVTVRVQATGSGLISATRSLKIRVKA